MATICIVRGAPEGLNANSEARPPRGHHGVEVKEQEGFLVLQADAVVHPGAVMVHFKNATAARTAVMRSWWLHAVALLAFLLHL